MTLDDEVESEFNESDVIAKKNLKEHITSFIIDSSANLLYWQPVLAVSEMSFMDYSFDEMKLARTGNILFAVTTGGVYGKAIDLGRYMLNTEYYDEKMHGANREKNWKTFIKDSAVDTLTTSLYWNAIMVPWLHFVNGMEWERVGHSALQYTAVYAIASAPYGKFFNAFRSLFETNS